MGNVDIHVANQPVSADVFFKLGMKRDMKAPVNDKGILKEYFYSGSLTGVALTRRGRNGHFTLYNVTDTRLATEELANVRVLPNDAEPASARVYYSYVEDSYYENISDFGEDELYRSWKVIK